MTKQFISGFQVTALGALFLLAGGCRLAPANAGVGELSRGRELAAGVFLDGGTPRVRVLAGDDNGRTQVVADFPGQDPLWSPDGALIAFARLGRRGVTQIWVAGPNGGHQRQLTTSPSRVHPESWSPSGNKLYYTVSGHTRGNPGPDQVWAVDVRSGRALCLSDGHGEDRHPVASPDGKYLAFSRLRRRHRGRSEPDIWVMRSNGSEPHRLTGPPDFAGFFAWSADGRWLYYGATKGTDPRILPCLAGARQSVTGTADAVAVLRRAGATFSIWRVRPDGSSRVMVVKGTPAAQVGSCSPEGDLMAYLVMDGWGRTDVYVAKPDGSESRNVSGDPADGYRPTWSRDGHLLAWLRREPNGGILGYSLSSGRQWCIAADTKRVVYSSVHWRPKGSDKPEKIAGRN